LRRAQHGVYRNQRGSIKRQKKRMAAPAAWRGVRAVAWRRSDGINVAASANVALSGGVWRARGMVRQHREMARRRQ
jgi:hypothetical protein